MSVLGGLRGGAAAPWVAEVWVDPQWYDCQSSPDRLPEPGPPTVVPLRGSQILIGRHSEAKAVTPHIDCDRDAGVSRRHAQLTRHGAGWVVEDLGSANGTYVSATLGEIPDDPIELGHPVGSGHVLYLGSWTRIVLREESVATSAQATQASPGRNQSSGGSAGGSSGTRSSSIGGSSSGR